MARAATPTRPGQPAGRALRGPRRGALLLGERGHKLLCQILRYGSQEDYVAAVEIWGSDAPRTALLTARRGEIDPKSARFWKLHLGVAEDAERPA